MAKRFTNKTRNKVVAKVERFFTWDNKIGGLFSNYDDEHDTVTRVYIGDLSWCGLYLSISKSVISTNEQIARIGGYVNTFHEINQFIKQVKLIG